MKYFEYIVILIFFITAVEITFYFYRRMKIFHFYRLIRKAFLKKAFSGCGENYLPTFYLREIAGLLIKAKANQPLVYLCAGRSGAAIRWLKAKNYIFLALILETIDNPNSTLSQFEKFIKQHPDNQAALAELGLLYFRQGNKAKAQLTLDNFNFGKKNSYARARANYLQAYLDMDNGDMLGASLNCSQATKIFHKIGCDYEEGQSYLLMGIIYRVAIVADVAQLMFDTALKIFRAANCQTETALVYGNLGMLMAIQKRFEEAADYYQKAEDIYHKKGLLTACADIYNQQALLNLMQNQLDKAEELAYKALKNHTQQQNNSGIAFSKEIIGNTAWNRKDHKLATQMAFEAKNLYKEQKNLSAYLENMYLMALSLFEQNKLKESEKILRDITTTAKQQTTNFHTANAYTLLGLIFLQNNDLSRAKGLFQQSLDLEQANNRLGGIATDYANISLIEWRRGDVEQARKTLETALEYAQANQEEELTEILQKRLGLISQD